jgi:hypothetical protein
MTLFPHIFAIFFYKSSNEYAITVKTEIFLLLKFIYTTHTSVLVPKSTHLNVRDCSIASSIGLFVPIKSRLCPFVSKYLMCAGIIFELHEWVLGQTPWEQALGPDKPN